MGGKGSLPSNAVPPLTVAYLATAFGWRTWRQWRTTGDAGIRVGRDGSREERIAGVLFAFSVTAVLAGSLQRPKDPGPVRSAGVALMLGGLLGMLVAQVDLGRSWRIGVDPDERTDLVTSGAFSVVRKPIFTAMATFSIGAALAQRNRTVSLAALSMVAAVEAQVRLVEEPYLRTVHGAAFAVYCKRVGRFLPRLGRRPLMSGEP